jgi:hypothetical protein
MEELENTMNVYQIEIGSAVWGRSVADRQANETGTESASQLYFETDQKSDHDFLHLKFTSKFPQIVQ